jgi:hypothetical protein
MKKTSKCIARSRNRKFIFEIIVAAWCRSEHHPTADGNTEELDHKTK